MDAFCAGAKAPVLPDEVAPGEDDPDEKKPWMERQAPRGVPRARLQSLHGACLMLGLPTSFTHCSRPSRLLAPQHRERAERRAAEDDKAMAEVNSPSLPGGVVVTAGFLSTFSH